MLPVGIGRSSSWSRGSGVILGEMGQGKEERNMLKERKDISEKRSGGSRSIETKVVTHIR